MPQSSMDCRRDAGFGNIKFLRIDTILLLFYYSLSISLLQIVHTLQEYIREQKGGTMDILFWIILGGVAGWVASIVMKTDYEQGLLLDIVLGIVGAIVGGFVLNMIGQPGVTGFNLYSLLVATLGAVVVIYLGRLLHR